MASTALVTGASSGIGLELSRVLARNGHHLILTARREENLKQIKKELEINYGIQVAIFSIDLALADAPQKLFNFTEKESLHIDILINNAGIGDYGFFHESDWEKTATMIDLNIRSLTHLTRLYLPQMIKQDRAYVMNVASTAAFQPGPLMSVYYASKHYVLPPFSRVRS